MEGWWTFRAATVVDRMRMVIDSDGDTEWQS